VDHKFLLILNSLAFVLWPGIAQPVEATPLPNTNLSPVIQIYGLPALGSSRVLDQGTGEAQLTMQIANHFTGTTTRNEDLLFDGETHRISIMLRYGIKGGMEWGIELPYVAQRGGFTDSFIENWHEAFGLFQGGRDRTLRDVLDYHYLRDGVLQFNVTQAGAGMGDIRLTAARQLTSDAAESKTRAALRASVKLPTGDSAQFLGSGGTDLAVWLSVSCGQAACLKRWSWYGGGGLLFLGKGDVLPDLQENLVGFGSIGVGWQLTSKLTFKGQIDGHTPFYKHSELEQLGDPAAQLTLGGTQKLGKNTALDLAVSEDLFVNTSPDVTFLVSLRTYF